MSQRMSLEEIRSFWTDQARIHGASPSASWSDHPVIDLEIREIVSRLSDGQHVLDAGCANGYSTLQFAAARQARIRGVDYIPEMIDEARRRGDELAGSLRGTVEFAVGDIMALDEPDGLYDTVVVIRVVINLGDWERQLTGLREAVRVLRPGGTLLLSEATLQGWRRLNALRAEWGLAEIPMPGFNNYLDEDLVVRALDPVAEKVDIVNFASSYFVASRLVKPLLARVAGKDDRFVFDPGSEWNRFAASLPAAGDYGTQKLFVFRKR